MAMQISSESDSDIEINPYWLKVKVDKLQGLGNPMETLLSDDPKLDLESTSETDDSVIFILTPPNSLCSTDSESGSLEERSMILNDKEIPVLTADEGEDRETTFNAAMLVNVKGSVEGIQMELYDSGASCHMSPY